MILWRLFSTLLPKYFSLIYILIDLGAKCVIKARRAQTTEVIILPHTE